MGCGESKHAVATENTVVSKSNSKRSNSIKNNTTQNDSSVPIVKENEIIETKPENVTDTVEEAVEVKKEEPKNDEIAVAKEEIVVGEEEKKEEVAVSNDSPSESEILSNDATVESVISGGVSGKSEYHSPPGSPRPQDKVVAVVGEEIKVEAKPEDVKDDAIKVDEEKEVAPTPVDETKESETIGEQKTPTVGEGNANVTSSSEIKAE